MAGESSPTRERIHEIILEADTPPGKVFDVVLVVQILISVVAVMLESVVSVRIQYGPWLRIVEWVVTIPFIVEYLLRLYCVRGPLRYPRSFFGIGDLLAVLPTNLSVIIFDESGDLGHDPKYASVRRPPLFEKQPPFSTRGRYEGLEPTDALHVMP